MLVHFAPFWSMFCLDFSAVVLIVVGGLDDVVCLVIIVKVMLVHFAPFWSMFCLDFSAVVLIVVGGLDDVVCLVIIVKVANDI
jgi:hypothetical protein